MSTVEKKPYIHLSIDDTFEIFKDLAQNAMYYSSIFENPYLHFLEMLHTQYGLVASMYCFTEEGDFSLSNVPDIFCPDFTKSADWLKWDFMAAARIPDTNMLPGGKRKKIILLLSENCCVSQGLSVVLMLLHGCIFLPELGNASGRCANQTTG